MVNKLIQISKGKLRIHMRVLLKFIKSTRERRWIDFCTDKNKMILPEFDTSSHEDLRDVLAIFINSTGITEIHGSCGLKSDKHGIEPKDFRMIFFILVLEDGKLKQTFIQYGNDQKQLVNEFGELQKTNGE